MNRFLTKQEQLVICLILGLLLTGWSVEVWRAAQVPPETALADQK